MVQFTSSGHRRQLHFAVFRFAENEGAPKSRYPAKIRGLWRDTFCQLLAGARCFPENWGGLSEVLAICRLGRKYSARIPSKYSAKIAWRWHRLILAKLPKFLDLRGRLRLRPGDERRGDSSETA